LSIASAKFGDCADLVVVANKGRKEGRKERSVRICVPAALLASLAIANHLVDSTARLAHQVSVAKGDYPIGNGEWSPKHLPDAVERGKQISPSPC
jgi:hypothetical protein